MCAYIQNYVKGFLIFLHKISYKTKRNTISDGTAEGTLIEKINQNNM